MRAAVDYRETDLGDVNKKIMVGNACGENPGSHESKAITIASLFPHIPASAAEQ